MHVYTFVDLVKHDDGVFTLVGEILHCRNDRCYH